MDLPQYTLKVAATRIALVKALGPLVLMPLLYGGAWINFFAARTTMWPWVVPAIVGAGIIFPILEYVWTYTKVSKFEYQFYVDRIEFHGQQIQIFYYRDYSISILKKNMLDKLLKTGTIQVSAGFEIGPVKKVEEINQYLTNMVAYTRRGQTFQ